MNTHSEVVERILNLLDERHLSIHALALNSGMAPSSIKNILYNKSKNPGIVTIKLICDGLGISLYEFFNTDKFREENPEDI